MDFALAHLSDPHLPIPDGALRPLAQLTGKRLLAYLAWLRKRRGNVRPEALLADLAAHAPDHVAVTGDLTNLGLPGEFAAARDWLLRLGPPERATVVRGNHDATAPMPWEEGPGHWRPWMAGDDDGGAGPGFPFLRRRGPVALIGLDSAVPTPPGSAAGRLGGRQLARLPALLEAAGRDGLFRVVLVHHPPSDGLGGRRRALRDRAALREALARSGAELVLHGHHHAASRAEVEGPAGPIPVLGAPHARRAVHGAAGWLLHRVAPDGEGGAWRIDTAERLWDEGAGAFRDARRWTARVSVSSAAGSPRCPRPEAA